MIAYNPALALRLAMMKTAAAKPVAPVVATATGAQVVPANTAAPSTEQREPIMAMDQKSGIAQADGNGPPDADKPARVAARAMVAAGYQLIGPRTLIGGR